MWCIVSLFLLDGVQLGLQTADFSPYGRFPFFGGHFLAAVLFRPLVPFQITRKRGHRCTSRHSALIQQVVHLRPVAFRPFGKWVAYTLLRHVIWEFLPWNLFAYIFPMKSVTRFLGVPTRLRNIRMMTSRFSFCIPYWQINSTSFYTYDFLCEFITF